MPEEVTYDSNRELMHIRVWGDDPIEDWVSSREKVLKLHEAHGCFMLLVDVREQETAPPILDIIEFGEDWPKEISLAILAGEKTREDVMVLETVAQHRSKSVRVFFDEDEALQWLHE